MSARAPPADLNGVFKEEGAPAEQQLWNQEEPEPLSTKEEGAPAEQLLWNQEEPEPLSFKEEEEELKIPAIKEEQNAEEGMEPPLLESRDPPEELLTNDGLNSRTKEPSWIKEEMEEPEPPWVPGGPDGGRLKEEAGLLGLDRNRQLVIKLHRIDSPQPPGSHEVDPSGNSKPTPEPLLPDVSPDQPEDPPLNRRRIRPDARGVSVHQRAFGRRPARKPHWCQECGKSFTQHSSLTAHVRIHTGERPFTCITCGKSFSEKSSLLIHSRIHTGEKPFSCDACGKAFSQRYGLLRHARSHTGERPHACRFCKKTFGQSYHLKKHMRVHARRDSCAFDRSGHGIGPAEERPQSCDTCAKGFRRRKDLLSHMRMHLDESPHSCDTCRKSFCQNSDSDHRRRVHACQTCGVRFRRSRDASCRAKTHAGERPYSCETCGKRFRRSCHLWSHRRTHQGGGACR